MKGELKASGDEGGEVGQDENLMKGELKAEFTRVFALVIK